MNLENLGRIIVGAAALLFVVGLLIFALGKLTGLSKLPGDLVYTGRNISCFFPIATSILISIVLTIIVNLILYLTRR